MNHTGKYFYQVFKISFTITLSDFSIMEGESLEVSTPVPVTEEHIAQIEVRFFTKLEDEKFHTVDDESASFTVVVNTDLARYGLSEVRVL